MSETVPESPRLAFSHETVDASPPSRELEFCHTTDLTGNGRPDIIVGKPYHPQRRVDVWYNETEW
jgi:hypothetical protein